MFYRSEIDTGMSLLSKSPVKDCSHVAFFSALFSLFFVAFFIAFLASTGSNGGMKNATKNARNGFGTHSVRKTLRY